MARYTPSIRLSAPDDNSSSQLPFHWAVGIALSMALFLGFGRGVIGALSLPVQGWILVLAGLSAAAALELFADKVRELLIALGAMLGGSVLLWVVAYKFTRAGLEIVSNAFTRLVALQELTILAEYAIGIPEGQWAIAVTLFLLPVALMLSLLCTVCARRNILALPPVLGAMLFILMWTTGSFTADGWLLLLIGFCLMLCRKSLIGRQRFSLIMPPAALCAGLLLFGFAADAVSKQFAGGRESILQAIHSMQYEGAQQPLFEGDIKAAAAGFNPTGDRAMTVTFEEPTTVYLRGFIGSDFEDGEWKTLPATDYYAQRALFYKLYQEEFFPQSQLTSFTKAAGGAKASSLRNLTVELDGACRAYAYAPYASYEVPEELLPNDKLDDLGLKAGAQKYSVVFLPNTTGRAMEFDAILKQKSLDPSSKLEKYLELEDRYRAFVYHAYTDLDEETAELFAKYFPEGAEQGENRLEYEAAKQNVRTLLAEVMDYSIASSTYDGTVESLAALLEDGGSGYFVQFASLGTQLMRYWGIPARYVEGYYIGNDEVADAEAGVPLTVTMKSAHAWVEYYHDGIGWIPFEVTPGFFATDEVPPPPPEEEPPPPPPPEEDPEKPPEQEVVPPPEEVKFELPDWAWGVLLILLAVAAWLYARKRAIENREKSYRQSDCKEAARAVMQHMLRVLGVDKLYPEGPSLYSLCDSLIDKFGESDAAAYSRAVDIASKAEFSGADIAQEEREELIGILKAFITSLDRRSDKPRRFVYRWLLWLY